MARAKVPTRSKMLVLTAVMASLLEIIDSSIVNVAIPTMMGNLGSTLDEISWVVTGYIIANAIVLPIAGWMSEQLGRKLYYTSCILLFTASSVACGLSPNLPVLVFFRIVQGFAGGALLPTSQALIYEAFPKEQAGMASAIFGMSVMIGPTVGPTLGGYLTDNLGWRSIFNVNLPIGIVVAVLSYLIVEDVGFVPGESPAEDAPKGANAPAKRQRVPIDYWGLLFLVVGLGSLQFVLERGHAEDWFSSTAICVCAVSAVVCLVGLVVWELRAPYPILELRHFQNRTFRSGVLIMTALGCMLYGLMFIIPVFVSTVLGLTATQTGELFIPGALASAAMMPFIGNQLRKRDARVLIFVGIASLAVAGLWIARFDALTSQHGMFWPLLLRGGAMAYLFVPINTVVLTQFTGVAIGQAAGMLNLSRQLGGSVGIAVMDTLFQRYQGDSYTQLASHVSLFSPAAVEARAGIAALFRGKLPNQVGMGTHALETTKLLFFRVQKQAFVLGYQKVLVVIVGLFVLLSIIPLFLMKPTKPGAGPVTAH